YPDLRTGSSARFSPPASSLTEVPLPERRSPLRSVLPAPSPALSQETAPSPPCVSSLPPRPAPPAQPCRKSLPPQGSCRSRRSRFHCPGVQNAYRNLRLRPPAQSRLPGALPPPEPPSCSAPAKSSQHEAPAR